MLPLAFTVLGVSELLVLPEAGIEAAAAAGVLAPEALVVAELRLAVEVTGVPGTGFFGTVAAREVRGFACRAPALAAPMSSSEPSVESSNNERNIAEVKEGGTVESGPMRVRVRTQNSELGCTAGLTFAP